MPLPGLNPRLVMMKDCDNQWHNRYCRYERQLGRPKENLPKPRPIGSFTHSNILVLWLRWCTVRRLQRFKSRCVNPFTGNVGNDAKICRLHWFIGLVINTFLNRLRSLLTKQLLTLRSNSKRYYPTAKQRCTHTPSEFCSEWLNARNIKNYLTAALPFAVMFDVAISRL